MADRTGTSRRVSGHALLAEGGAHQDNGEQDRTYWGGVSGPGRGKCSCGALSDVLASAGKRKAWHRAHKAEVSGG